jgi:hypothetical protein
MVRIGGGVYPEIRERDYLTERGEYRVDAGGAPAMLKSLMYKLSYYELRTGVALFCVCCFVFLVGGGVLFCSGLVA